MRRDKHKRKVNQVLIVTSDNVNAEGRPYVIRKWVRNVCIILLCVFIGGSIGYFVNENYIWDAMKSKYNAQEEVINQLADTIMDLEGEIKSLESDKVELIGEINDLEEQKQMLSEALNSKIESETKLTQQLASQSLPTEFPLTGSASIEETTVENNPICVFDASEGTNVIATANGTVTAVNDDVVYGHNVWVDHGNGYITIYRNKGDAAVKVGDSVVQGTMLFTVTSDNTMLGYQMMLDGTYIDPMEMLEING